MQTTDPSSPDYINPQFLSLKGYAEFLVRMRDRNFTQFPTEARSGTDAGYFIGRKGEFILHNPRITVSEGSPKSYKLTSDVFVHFGPTSRRTTNKLSKIKGANKDDFMFGGINGDILIGGKGSDFLVGDRGSDVLIGGPGVDYFWGGIGPDVYKGLKGDDIFINFDLYGYSNVIGDKIKDVAIVGRGPEEYDSTLITHKKGSIVIIGWSPDEVAEANIF